MAATRLIESILPMAMHNLEEYLVDTLKFVKGQGFRNQKW